MTATTTRSRTTTTTSTAPTPTRRRATTADRARPWAYVDGANALQIGYAEPDVDESYALPDPFVDPSPRVEPESEARPGAAPVTLPRPSLIVLGAVLVIAAVLGVLVLNTKINENSFALDNLRSQQSQLDVQEQQLSQQLADLESAGNLSAQAARLGLVPAGTPGFLNLSTGKVVSEPTPATGNASGSGTATSGDPGR
jgi:hypothetical protein